MWNIALIFSNKNYGLEKKVFIEKKITNSFLQIM